MRKAVFYPFLLLLVLSLPAAALANQLDLFGFTARASSLANAYSALTDGPEAAFYNPGALIESRDIRAFGSFSFSVPALSTDRQTADGGNKSDPAAVGEAKEAKAGQWLGAGVSGGIYDRVFFGLAMQVPTDGAERRKIFSPDQPYFLDYDTGIFGATFVPAVAVQVAPNFGLGVGLRLTMDPLGYFETAVPTTDGDLYAHTSAQAKFNGQAAPIFGFYARSHEYLRFGLTFSGASYSYYHKTVRQTVVPDDPNGFVEVEYEAKYNYIPRKLTLAIVGQPDEHVQVTAEMDYIGWSSYTPPFPKLRLDFSNMAANDISYVRPRVLKVRSADFSDIFVTRLGVEPRVNKYLAFRAGYAYEPSPVPDQTGTSTIIDSATHVFALGIGGNFGGPKGDLAAIDLSVMDHYSKRQIIDKSNSEMDELDPATNPAFPRLQTSSHYVYSAVTATFHF